MPETNTVPPKESLFSQFGVFSTRRHERFADTLIEYDRVLLGECTPPQKIALRELVLRELENPCFLPYSQEMPYTPEEFDELLNNPNAVVMLAWKKGNSRPSERELVGYISGIPGVDENLTVQDLTTESGLRLTQPRDTTFFFDTYAVKEGERGKQIGRTLWTLFRENVFYPGGPYNSLIVFALEDAHTLSMLENDTWVGLNDLREKHQVSEGDVPYRGWSARYLFIDLKNRI